MTGRQVAQNDNHLRSGHNLITKFETQETVEGDQLWLELVEVVADSWSGKSANLLNWKDGWVRGDLMAPVKALVAGQAGQW